MTNERKQFPATTRSGFSLIEILLALLVVTIGIVAITGLLGTSLDTATKSHADLDAVSFADMVFNHYHASTNWADIPPDGTLSVPAYNGSDFDLQLGQLDQFTCQAFGSDGPTPTPYTVSYVFDAQARGARVKELTLQVWPGPTSNGPARIFYTEIYNWAGN